MTHEIDIFDDIPPPKKPPSEMTDAELNAAISEAEIKDRDKWWRKRAYQLRCERVRRAGTP